MNPSQLLTELVNAVLAWEEADALRARLIDSRSTRPADLQAANVRLVTAIKRLRIVAREVRKLVKNPAVGRKKKMTINWGKVIDTVAKVSVVVKDIKDKANVPANLPPGIDPTKVVDMPHDT